MVCGGCVGEVSVSLSVVGDADKLVRIDKDYIQILSLEVRYLVIDTLLLCGIKFIKDSPILSLIQ